jgi:negative regulator of flagellin synthesis FlgM
LKISEQEVSRLLSYSPSERSGNTYTRVGSQDQVQHASRVDISPTAQDIQRVIREINRLPDVREDRVLALKAQIDSGSYHVSGEDIADLMIRRALADNTAL